MDIPGSRKGGGGNRHHSQERPSSLVRCTARAGLGEEGPQQLGNSGGDAGAHGRVARVLWLVSARVLARGLVCGRAASSVARSSSATRAAAVELSLSEISSAAGGAVRNTRLAFLILFAGICRGGIWGGGQPELAHLRTGASKARSRGALVHAHTAKQASSSF